VARNLCLTFQVDLIRHLEVARNLCLRFPRTLTSTTITDFDASSDFLASFLGLGSGPWGTRIVEQLQDPSRLRSRSPPWYGSADNHPPDSHFNHTLYFLLAFITYRKLEMIESRLHTFIIPRTTESAAALSGFLSYCRPYIMSSFNSEISSSNTLHPVRPFLNTQPPASAIIAPSFA
jgi:hypothetical protein